MSSYRRIFIIIFAMGWLSPLQWLGVLANSPVVRAVPRYHIFKRKFVSITMEQVLMDGAIFNIKL